MLILTVLVLLSPLSLTAEESNLLEIVANPASSMRGTILGAQTIYITQKRVGELLNLTCRVIEPLTDYQLVWTIPPMAQNREHRVHRYPGRNSLQLIVEKLHEVDNGEYACVASPSDIELKDEVLTATVKVNIKTLKACGAGHFQCANGDCIFQRYMCDGRSDCKNGDDENITNCGLNPCTGKLHCPDDRCIPFSWCCDRLNDLNCTVKEKLPCCHHFLKPFEHEDRIRIIDNKQRFQEEGMIQTTIYIAVGSAMTLVFIVFGLMCAIWRIHMKRQSVLNMNNRLQSSRCSSSTAAQTQHHMQPLYEMCRELRNPPNEFQPTTGFLVTYNINNGVQFVGRPVSPPPYTEVVSTPPREGPPPPYISQENLTRNAQQPGQGDEVEVTTPLTSASVD